MVGTVIHSVENDFEFNCLRRPWLCNFLYRDEGNVVDDLIFVHKARVRNCSRGVICDRRRDIYVIIILQRCSKLASRGELTGIQSVWDCIKHVGIHIGMDRPIT